MNRQTTREEYKAFMRKWRAVVSECSPPDRFWMRDKSVRQEARNIAFGAVYKIVPRDFWDMLPPVHKPVYAAKESCGWLLNAKYAPNSYPHETRNP